MEFTLRRRRVVEAHQVKRQHGSANYWTLGALRAEDVLDAARHHVMAGREFHFVSTIPARELDRLAGRARRSPDLEVFLDDMSANDDLRKRFDYLKDMYSSSEIAWRTLRGIHAECAPEREVRNWNAALAGLLLTGASARTAAAALGDLIVENLAVPLDYQFICDRLGDYGLAPADIIGVTNTEAPKTRQRIVPFDTVDEPEPGMLYSDRLGPWFDLDGNEIIPVGSEAVEIAVELVIGTFQLRSNLPEIDGTSVAIDFPLLTQLMQKDWDRVMGGEDGQLPGRGFLIAYRSSAAAVGRLAEDLLYQVVLERLLAAYRPQGRVVAVGDAVRSGELVAPSSGERCDDVVIADPGGLILVEAKSTVGGWSYLGRMVCKAVRQVTRSARADPRVTAAVVLASSLKDHRVGVWWHSRGALLAGPSAGSANADCIDQ